MCLMAMITNQETHSVAVVPVQHREKNDFTNHLNVCSAAIFLLNNFCTCLITRKNKKLHQCAYLVKRLDIRQMYIKFTKRIQ